MEQALLNTVMSIIIVFVALIFISFFIYLLKFVPNLIELFSGKDKKEEEVVVPKAPKPPAAPPVSVKKEEDTEVIAVISAAIAAAMSETTGQVVSPDGLVIRKIKKRRA